MLSAQTADPTDYFIAMIRKIESGNTTPKSGHSGKWTTTPGRLFQMLTRNRKHRRAAAKPAACAQNP